MSETLRGDRLAIQAIHAHQMGNPDVSDMIIDYVLSLDMQQLRSQFTLRSIPRAGRSEIGLRAVLALKYHEDIIAGWWLDPARHMLLKNVNDYAGVSQETSLVVGRRLGYIIPVDEYYRYIYKVGFSGSEDLPLIMRPDNVDTVNSLCMDIEIEAIMADESNNHIGGPLVRSAGTLYCRPYGGHARLVFGLQLEDMDKMGLIYCQLDRDPQGKELCLSGDVALFPRGVLSWLDRDDLTDGGRLWPGGPTQEEFREFEMIRRGRLQ